MLILLLLLCDFISLVASLSSFPSQGEGGNRSDQFIDGSKVLLLLLPSPPATTTDTAAMEKER